MNRRIVLIACLLVIILAALCILRRREPKTAPQAQTAQTSVPSPLTAVTPNHETEPPNAPIPDIPGASLTGVDKENVGKIIAAFGAPIVFFGKVVDQTGNPVKDAKVYYSAADQYFGDSSKYQGISDSIGRFSITGIRGAGVYVEVSKEGYDRIPDESYSSFGYGVPSGKRPPTKGTPAIFTLRKKTEAEPLIAIDRDVIVPKDGTPVEVSLKTGKAVLSGKGDLKIECWADDGQKDVQRRYHWRFRLSVPDGGLVERTDTTFAFQAPADGYEPSEEFEMPPSVERWKDSFDTSYFVRLRDGTYARMRFRITTGGDHYASITSYLNPQPGSRNLEFDSRKTVKPPH